MDTKELWNKIVDDLVQNPRNLNTRPKTKVKPKTFYAYYENGLIKVASAKNCDNPCQISGTRKIDYTIFERVYPIYLKREEGQSVSQEATEATRNSVYLYSIIYDCLGR